jgi:hypothetical protein
MAFANVITTPPGRLWGWDAAEDEICAYKNPSSGAPVYLTPPPQVTNETQSDPPPQLAPSAAGPVLNATVPDNSTADFVNGNTVTSDSQSKGRPGPDLQADQGHTQEDNSTVVRAAVSHMLIEPGSRCHLLPS